MTFEGHPPDSISGIFIRAVSALILPVKGRLLLFFSCSVMSVSSTMDRWRSGQVFLLWLRFYIFRHYLEFVCFPFSELGVLKWVFSTWGALVGEVGFWFSVLTDLPFWSLMLVVGEQVVAIFWFLCSVASLLICGLHYMLGCSYIM